MNKIYSLHMTKCTPNFEMKSHEATRITQEQIHHNIKENHGKNVLFSIIEPK